LRVDNDARTYARAEYNIGAGKGAKRILMITLGTGIGRAYGENGKIKNLKIFETNESWEKEYQKIYEKKALAEFLGEKLAPIIKYLNPEIVVLGGGVVQKKGYFEVIKKALSNRVAKLEIKCSKLGKFAGAIGAAMLHE
jgi:predicted NBD/HSP70 family sugar kinase